MALLPPLVTLICNGMNFTKSTVLHGSKTGENNLEGRTYKGQAAVFRY